MLSDGPHVLSPQEMDPAQGLEQWVEEQAAPVPTQRPGRVCVASLGGSPSFRAHVSSAGRPPYFLEGHFRGKFGVC